MPIGSRIPVRFSVRNPSKVALEFPIFSNDPALAIATHRLVLRPSEEKIVSGELAVGEVAPGVRTYRIRYESPIAAVTKLIVEVVPRIVRLEFEPSEIALDKVVPGTAIRREAKLRNIGNTDATARIAASESWLGVAPSEIHLARGESVAIAIVVRTRKTDCGERTARIRASLAGGYFCDLKVCAQLPEPKLEAMPVDFGEVEPDRTAHATLAVRNVGKVRVVCSLEADRTWLSVAPVRVNLPPGGEKTIELRATLPVGLTGPQTAQLSAFFRDARLLGVPVSAFCRTPEPLLGPIRKQNLGTVAADEAIVRRFSVPNVGDGHLICTVSADRPWLEILTETVAIEAGKKRRIEYRLLAPSMEKGVHLATIRIRSNGGEAEVPISVRIVDAEPILEIVGERTVELAAKYRTATGQILLRNSGTGQLRIQAIPTDERAVVSPRELTIGAGPPLKVSIAFPIDGLEGGDRSFSIRFASNGGSEVANVRLQLPMERIEAPSVIDLGNRLLQEPIAGSIDVRNVGPDGLELAAIAEDPRIHLAVPRFRVQPGEERQIHFRIVTVEMDPGPVQADIELAGRMIRHRVAIRLNACRIELIISPTIVDFGTMRRSEERAISFRVVNRGNLSAEIADIHRPGELEVWIRGQTVQPGANVAFVGRARMNGPAGSTTSQAAVRLGDGAVVRFVAHPRRSPRLRVAFAALLGVGLAIAIELVARGNWALATVAAATASLVASGVLISQRGR